MVRKKIIVSMFLAVLFGYSPLVIATKFPHVPFEAAGRIFDWDTKKPLDGAHFIVFLNGAFYADNNGWAGDHDYPNLPRSDQDGYFKARTKLYRGTPDVKVNKVELIVFREGYRTERFVFDNPKYSVTTDKNSGTIEIPDLYLLKNRTTQ